MIEFLQKLIQIQSISPRDEGCFDLIEERLNKLNFKCERINYLNVENLYATYGDKGKIFCFLGHTDVVPTGPEDQWTQGTPGSIHIGAALHIAHQTGQETILAIHSERATADYLTTTASRQHLPRPEAYQP